MKHKRLHWGDIAKGIGIILVIIGHVNTIFNTPFIIFIYSFHMPLFFFLAGYFFTNNKNETIGLFVKKKAKTLLIPYAVFSVISIAFYWLIGSITIDKIPYYVITSIWANSDLINTPLWFLACLFLIELIVKVVLTLGKDKLWVFSICTVMCAGLGFYGYLLFRFKPPFCLDSALYQIVFFYLGYLVREKWNKNSNKYIQFTNKRWLFLLIGFLLLISAFLLSNKFEKDTISIVNGVTLIEFIMFYLIAIIGIIMVISLSYGIGKCKVIEFYGKNSIYLVACHLPVLAIFQWIIVKFEIVISNKYIFAVVATIFVCIISYPLIVFCNRYLPWMTGKKLLLKKKECKNNIKR